MALPVNLPDHTRIYCAHLPNVTTATSAYVTAASRGRVVAVYTALHAAVATTNAVLTPKINATAMTLGGVGVASATVTDGGTGYTVGDLLYLQGGHGYAAILAVDTEAAGVITAVTVNRAGDYSVIPADPAATSYRIPAAGQTGGTFGLTATTNTAIITVTAAGSAAGDVDTVFPTSNNYVNAGDALVITSNGGPDDATVPLTAVFVVRETN
jgi:hypothetical protein